MNRAAKIDQVCRLLSFDRFLANAAQQDRIPASLPDGPIPFLLDDTGESFSNRVPSLRLVGFDEAGRGSLAGPVTVACVTFELRSLLSPTGDLQDSVPAAGVGDTGKTAFGSGSNDTVKAQNRRPPAPGST